MTTGLLSTMENLEIEAQNDNFYTPKVSFNAQTGICEIAGESYLEDAFAFYKPLKDWLSDYFQILKKSLVFNFRLTYFSTSSSKSLLSILKMLKTYQENGFEIKVNWYCRFHDKDMLDDIEDLIFESNLEIELFEI